MTPRDILKLWAHRVNVAHCVLQHITPEDHIPWTPCEDRRTLLQRARLATIKLYQPCECEAPAQKPEVHQRDLGTSSSTAGPPTTASSRRLHTEVAAASPSGPAPYACGPSSRKCSPCREFLPPALSNAISQLNLRISLQRSTTGPHLGGRHVFCPSVKRSGPDWYSLHSACTLHIMLSLLHLLAMRGYQVICMNTCLFCKAAFLFWFFPPLFLRLKWLSVYNPVFCF